MKKKFEQVRTLVQLDKLKDACKVLMGTYLQNEGILLLSRLTELDKKSNLGLIDYAQRDLQRNNIRFGLLSIAQDLEDFALEGKKKNVLAKSIYEAESLFYERRFNESAKAFQAILEEHPEQIDALIGLGKAYDELGQYELAFNCYNSVIKLNPFSSRSYNNIGILFSKLHNTKKALEYYSMALKLEPDQEIYFNNKLNLLKRLGKHQDTIQLCDEAIRQNPDAAHF